MDIGAYRVKVRISFKTYTLIHGIRRQHITERKWNTSSRIIHACESHLQPMTRACLKSQTPYLPYKYAGHAS